MSQKTYEYLLKLITVNEFKDGKLPPETELAEKLGVSRTTIRDALRQLEAEGYIARRRKVGTTIIANKPMLNAGVERLNSITQIIQNAGMKPGTTKISYRIEKANAVTTEKLELDLSEDISVLERVRTADGVPFCLDISFIPVKYFSAEDCEKLDESLFAYLSTTKNISINKALSHLLPYASGDVIGKKLDLTEKKLLILLEQTHYAKGKAIWYSRSFYRSDIIAFHIIRKK